MYSPKTTQKTLEMFASREGWTPVPHTIEEVDEFKKYISSIVNIESNSRNSYIELAKPLSVNRQKEISRWIENEQVLCFSDCSYWESRYAYIRTETGEIARFKNRAAQTILDSSIADLDERGLPKELIVLGSRQNGTSTKIILKCIHRALFSPNSRVLLSSSTGEKSEFMGEIADNVFNQCPWWLVPQRLPKRKFSNGSGLVLSGTGQGFTPDCVYVTDAGDYPTPMKTFEEGLFRAVQSSARTMMVIHGRMPNKGTWLRNIWDYSKQYYPKGMSKFMPVFIPWYVSSDIYPTKEWTARFPAPEKWVPAKETKEHVLRCELYVRNTPILTKALGNGWKMPTEQKWYWEHTYNYAKATDIMSSFLLNMSADDTEHLANAEVFEDDVDLDLLFPQANLTQMKMEREK